VSNTKFKVEQLAQSPGISRATLEAESAKLRQQQQGLEGMFSAFRTGVERALVDEARRTARDGQRVLDIARNVISSARGGDTADDGSSARRVLADVQTELEDEGAPEDTPAGGRKAGVPRDPVAAAAAASAALDALRAKAAAAQAAAAGPPPPPPPPPLPPQTQEQAAAAVGELTDEMSVVSERLVAMQARMNKLLSDNNKLLAELEGVKPQGDDRSGPADASGAGSLYGEEEVGGTATQGGRHSVAAAQRSEAVAAAAAAMAAAAKVAAASAAVAAAADGVATSRTRRTNED
jgi:hypothetical protein